MKNQRLLIITAFGIAGVLSLLTLTSCKSNTETVATRADGWTVRFCKSKTQAPTVKLRIGVGGDNNSHTDWTTWTSDMNELVPVPDRFKHVQEVWVRGDGEPRGRNVHMCVEYNGNSTQKMTFDNGEEHETSQGDRDNCDC